MYVRVLMNDRVSMKGAACNFNCIAHSSFNSCVQLQQQRQQRQRQRQLQSHSGNYNLQRVSVL